MYPQLEVRSVQIPAGATGLSAKIDLADKEIVAILFPSTWGAAVLTYAGAPEGSDTLVSVTDSGGAEVSLTVAASQFIEVLEADRIHSRFVQLRSGTLALPVNQTNAPTLKLVLRYRSA